MTGNDDLIKMDGYNDCFIGIVRGNGMPDKACYDYKKVIRKNMHYFGAVESKSCKT